MRRLIERLQSYSSSHDMIVEGYSMIKQIDRVLSHQDKYVKEAPGRKGMVRLELGSNTYVIKGDDVKDFLLHMRDKYSIPYRGLSRAEYEKLSKKLRVKVFKDSDLGQGDDRGDFGMYHYDTEKKNRKSGIEGTLRQRRYWDMKKEKQDNKERAMSSKAPVKEGQLWEPCEKCGREPSYLPLHLCDKCWPK